MKEKLHLLFNVEHLTIAAISLSFTAILFFLFSFNVGFLNPVRRAFADFSMSDVYYSIIWQGSKPTESEHITLVDIDSLYLRKDIAKVINEVDQFNPKVVGVDIIFEGKKFDDEGDSLLTAALTNNFENKVIGYKLLNPDMGLINFKNSLHSFCIDDLPFIDEGYTNALYSEAGTTLRMFTMFREEQEVPTYSFPAKIYNKYIENYEEIDTTQLNNRHINFSTTKFPVVRFDSIANYPELIKDHIVLIGAVNEEADKHYTPIGRIPGIEIQAYSIQSLIDKYEIDILDEGSVWIIAFLAALITGILQFSILHWLKEKKEAWSEFLLKSVIFIRLFTFSLLALIAYIAFLFYILKGVFISTTAILIATVLVSEARGFYTAIVNHINIYYYKHNKIIVFPNSLFVDPKQIKEWKEELKKEGK